MRSSPETAAWSPPSSPLPPKAGLSQTESPPLSNNASDAVSPQDFLLAASTWSAYLSQALASCWQAAGRFASRVHEGSALAGGWS